MSRDDFGAILILLVIALIGGVVGSAVGSVRGVDQGIAAMEREAVKRGLAEYVLVNGGPEAKFQWKEKAP